MDQSYHLMVDLIAVFECYLMAFVAAPQMACFAPLMVDLVAVFVYCLMAFVTDPLMVCSADLDFDCYFPVVQVVAVVVAVFVV